MFVIFYGSGSESFRLGDAGVRECPACLRESPFSLVFQYDYSHIYYLFGRVTRRRFLIQCDECGNFWPASPEDIGDARTLTKGRIPFHRRWGCLLFVLTALLFGITGFAVLVSWSEKRGEEDRRREEQERQERVRKWMKPPPADKPPNAPAKQDDS